MTHRILQPEGWPRPKGYSNGIVATGHQVHLAGQIGWNAAGELVEGGLVAQARQALQNIVTLLAEAGARPAHLVRLTWYVTDRARYLAEGKAIGEVYREVIGRHYPAMSAVEVSGLMEPGAVIEIEATAVLP